MTARTPQFPIRAIQIGARHRKDMGDIAALAASIDALGLLHPIVVRPDGFLIAEVPLGTGFLDLPTMVATVRRARPEIHLNLEMITRDPLEVPCLTENYWATFADLSGRHLARSLTMVRDHAARQPLRRISGLSLEAQLQAEEDNVRRSFAFARAELNS